MRCGLRAARLRNVVPTCDSSAVDTSSLDAAKPTVVPRGAGTIPSLTHPALPRLEVKLDESANAGFSMLEYVVPAGFAPPPVLHRHTRESATGYIVEGHLTHWFEDGTSNDVGPGSVIHLPAGAWFRWANETDQIVRMIFVFKPAGFEQSSSSSWTASPPTGVTLRQSAS
ncbi:MAG: cupin domain-containing protein [Ilumatobacteraceae bacterium]